MQRLSKHNIEKLQKYFASQKDVVAVYLYGSFAKGISHPGSDLDIGVLFKEELRSFNGKVNLYKRLGRLYSDFPNLSIAAECEIRDINLDDSPVFLMNVIRGILIYSSDEIKRIRFEVEVMNLFRDTEYLRKIKYYYMNKRLREGTYGYRLHNS